MVFFFYLLENYHSDCVKITIYLMDSLKDPLT
jgi:hypothetical protein